MGVEPSRSQMTRAVGALEAVELEPGTVVDRYMVLERVGAGGMGIVYAAYDPELGRKVALKLLRSYSRSSSVGRVQQEARALARLSHPSVVAIHDIGVYAEQLWLAMEYVEGVTLREWLAAASRSWPEVLAVLVDVGQGVVAAHAAGILHRDLKPTNIMVDERGHAKVMDFGLARDQRDGLDELDELSEIDEQAKTFEPPSGDLTQPGMIVGTPAYMAPEQLAGLDVDARADQFSFCATLWEALYGERPFVRGEGHGVLGTRRSAPRSSKVPRWLRRTCARGLELSPGRRWPSMAALVDALSRGRARRRRRVATVLALLASAAIGVGVSGRERAQVCAGMDEHLTGVWDGQARDELERAILATQLSYAASTWTQVEAALDSYVDGWVSARTEACWATQRGEQSGELLDLRMACLDDRRDHLRALVDELSAADISMLSKAIDAVNELPGLERCADAEALTAALPRPEDPRVARQVALAEARLAEAKSKRSLGRYEEGRAVAAAVVSEAEALAYQPLLVRALIARGTLEAGAADHESAAATLARAYELALASRMIDAAGHAATRLIQVVGGELVELDQAHRWAAHASPLVRLDGAPEAQALLANNLGVLAWHEGDYAAAREHYELALATLRASGRHDPLTAAKYTFNLGLVAWSLGDDATARAYYERTLAVRERVLGADHPDVAQALNNLGVLAQTRGDHARARRYLERALELKQAAFGPNHLELVGPLVNLGHDKRIRGDLSGAQANFERALEIEQGVLGPEHPDVATELTILGKMAELRGQFDKARRLHQRALAVQARALGADHPTLGYSLVSLGSVDLGAGREADARSHCTRALEVWQAALGPEHVNVGAAIGCLAAIAAAAGEPDQALRHYERARAIVEAAAGPDDARVAPMLTGLGLARLELGEPEAAQALVERALRLQAASGASPVDQAVTRLALARVLWRREQRARAQRVVDQAQQQLQRAGAPQHPALAQFDAWLLAQGQ